MQHRNIEKRCIIKGEGEPILFAHGVAGPITVEYIANGLSKNFRTIVPTFPGYLKEDEKIDYSDELYTDFLEDLRLELGLERINLVGFSLGGRTAINYAIQYPDKVSKLIIICPAGLSNPFKGLPLVKVWGPQLVNQLCKNPKYHSRFAPYDFADEHNKSCKIFKEHFSGMMEDETLRTNSAKASTESVLPRKDWKQKLSSFKEPTLILWGSDDKIVPAKFAPELQSMIENSKLSVLEGYGHIAVVENPDFFVKEIAEFLKD